MGRTANPIPVPESSVGKLAARLRTGLARKGFGYRELAEQTQYHPTTLQRAASGKGVPSWPVVKDFAGACDLDQEEIRKLWEAARREKARRLRDDPPRAVGVTQVGNYAELGVLLASVRAKKDSPPYLLIERRAEVTKRQFGRLPHSTAWRIAVRQTRPSLHQMRAFLVGCNVPPQRHGPYVRAWERADAQYRRDLAREISKAAIPDDLRRRDPYLLARELGFVPREPFRGYHLPWTVACRFCHEDVRRIRLSRAVADLNRPADVCPVCNLALHDSQADRR
ncbi:helix-turn-helix domain-containing protein [Streptomyces sp. NPDC015492]|uniref:helix-turn-helix domain-containing protein n=1 Tax=Streptomyces sp. NPDC015492 TaxID=3364958 RepID=UPI0037036ABC